MTINGSSGLIFPDGSGQETGIGRNRIINGSMQIDQRNNGASVTPTSPGATYTLDRWRVETAGGGVYTVQRSTVAPSGFINSLLVTVTTADSSIAAADYYNFQQFIEGFNVADLAWGTANAQTITVSFWVRSSVTGTFAGSICNSGGTRSYVFTYTISAANTWEKKSITIPGDTSGTWLTNNGRGIILGFDLGNGSDYQATAGSWISSYAIATSSSVKLISTVGATFYITGVQLEVGSTATPFERRLYGNELALCQRYFETSYEAGNAVGSTSNPSRSIAWFAQATQSYNNQRVSYAVSKRANPSVAIYNPSTGVANQIRNLDSLADLAGGVSGGSTSGFFGYVNGVSVSVSVSLGYHYTASSEL
jgi:hypothetical protein